ncbi:MAG: hypothetical protein R6U17_02875 [Thermoplasmata archaeon]
MKNNRIICMALVVLLLISIAGVFFTAGVRGQEHSGVIYTTNEERTLKNDFFQGNALVYFTIEISPPEETDVIIRLRDDDYSLVDSLTVTTSDSGAYISADHGVSFDMIGQAVGTYHLNLTADGALIDSHEIEIYDEQDFTQLSTVMTTDENFQERDFFPVGEEIFFKADIKDQHGWPPAGFLDSVNVYVEHDGETGHKGLYFIEADGTVTGSFWENRAGDCILIIRGDDDVEYARYSFTIMQMTISIYPDRSLYTQGQTIEIRIESNYPENIDVAIVNSTTEPFRYMRDGEWADQSFTNEIWAAEYSIPHDEADGEYFITVTAAGEDTIMSWESFSIKRYSLMADTDKRVYLPGEQVDVNYLITTHLNGSGATGVDVEWMVGYLDEDNDWNTFKDTADHGFFNFWLPDDVRLHSEFVITMWANDTAEGYEDTFTLAKYCGRVEAHMELNKYTYLQGENVYIDVRTFARAMGVQSATGPMDVEVSLIRDGETVTGYTYNLATDEFGQVSHYINMSQDLETGIYSIVVNATWEDQWDVKETEFELIDESQRLIVHLESDRGSAYYPGETVNVSYWITHVGDIVDHANVRYKVYSEEGVYGSGFGNDGFINFQIPDDFSQDLNLWLEVIAAVDQDITGTSTIDIPVSLGRIFLNPSQWNYRAEDQISFEYILVGLQEENVEDVEYQIQDQNEDVIEVGSPTDNSFDFNVPERPRDLYTVSVSVVTFDGIRLKQVETVRKIIGFKVEVTVETSSSYTTDVYSPDQEITVRYKLVSEDGRPLPEYAVVTYVLGDDYGEFGSMDSEGTFTFEVPEASDGVYPLVVTVNGYDGYKTIEIQNNPSWMNRRIVGGLGAFGLIILIFLIIALLVGGYSFYHLFLSEKEFGLKREKIKPEEDIEEDTPDVVIEDGEPEPEDTWHEDSQIEPEHDDW